MLIWVTALHCEAKPVIDFYRLKKSAVYRSFDLYQNDKMQCVISGIGKTSAAAATAWVAALNHQAASIAWINLGIAGAASQGIGEIFWLNKVTDGHSNQHYYPTATFNHPIQPASCISLDQPVSDYHADVIHDMEASAFFVAATRFSTSELAHSLKVISDNHQQQTAAFDKPVISRLIQKQLETIDCFAQNLLQLNQPLIDADVAPHLWQQVLQRAHFSQTQQARLKTLLQFLRHQVDSDALLLEMIDGLQSSRCIIARLEQRCCQLSRNL